MLRTSPYRSCSGSGQIQIRVKGSRFLGLLEECHDREWAEQRLAALHHQYHKATHICWAWRLISEPEPGEASSDGGEPAGTACVPMLRVLRSDDLWNILAVVIRWFGGTKLGRGGLIRAYRDSLAGAVKEAILVDVLPRVDSVISAPVDFIGDLYRLLSPLDIRYLDENVDGDVARIAVSLPAGNFEKLKARVVDVTRGRGSVSPTGH